jgi:hypothetical protein
MTTTKYLLKIIFFTFIIISCKDIQKTNNNAVQCKLEIIEKNILELEEVKVKMKMIDSISSHKKGLSFINDSLKIDDVLNYELKVGYNSDIRFETYFIFYVDKNNCSNIKILEPIEGQIITINEWRTINQSKNIILDENLIEESENLLKKENQINKIVTENQPYNLFEVPFDLKGYVKNLPKEINNSYTPSNELIDYLKIKNYDGESYNCYFLKINNNHYELLVSVSRGDSIYFLLVKINENKILSYKEIGVIGEEIKYFIIDKNYAVKFSK